jgi:tryptophan synthase alpha chain
MSSTGKKDSPSRLATAFLNGICVGRPLIIPFVTAGFPERTSTRSVVEAVCSAGADVVEIGIPFSDPLADGPTIQRSSEVALKGGMTVAGVLEIVDSIRSRAAARDLPVVLMGYFNPLLAYGLERFLDDAKAAGVDGLILPDVPPEEGRDYRAACVERDLAATFLVAPNAPDERIRLVDQFSTHFSYCVTVTGVTGARGEVQGRTLEFLRRVRSLALKPFVVGFGIKEAAHVLELGPHADGVVVGSALIDALSKGGDPGDAAVELIAPLREAAERVASERETKGTDDVCDEA